jgi:hypothetical protein
VARLAPPASGGRRHALSDDGATYWWASRADHTAVEQFARVWADDDAPPVSTWVNFTDRCGIPRGRFLPDMAASAVCDSDARLGRIFDVIEQSGRWATVLSSWWPITGWRRPTRPCRVTGMWRWPRPTFRRATRDTASCTSAPDAWGHR